MEAVMEPKPMQRMKGRGKGLRTQLLCVHWMSLTREWLIVPCSMTSQLPLPSDFPSLRLLPKREREATQLAQ